MVLKFKYKYKSINTFDDVNLPKLTIITGKNESGKTQLLESIKKGSSVLHYVTINKIKYFSSVDFSPRNQQLYNTQSLNNDKLIAWTVFSGNSNNWNYSNIADWDAQIKNSLGEVDCPYDKITKDSLVHQNKQLIFDSIQNLSNNQQTKNTLNPTL